MYSLTFEELFLRLVAFLQESVRNGDMTERRLARITGVSQPHIHHVLCGKRHFSPDMADRVLAALRNDILDFLEIEDIEEWKSRS